MFTILQAPERIWPVCFAILKPGALADFDFELYRSIQKIWGRLLMIVIWKTENGKLVQQDHLMPGCWIQMTEPDEKELAQAEKLTGLSIQILKGPLDLSEQPGASLHGKSVRILIDVPDAIGNQKQTYQTLPLSIIVNPEAVITISPKPCKVLEKLVQDPAGIPQTSQPLAFLNSILASAARCYQEDLQLLDARRQEVETRAGEQVAKLDLIALHEVETSLIWFGCSLKENIKALEQLQEQLSSSELACEQEKLEEAMVEMNQAASMTQMYREIAAAARDLIADLADNRLNNVMKFLTSMTLVLAVPTIVSGFYGMNVDEDSIPLAHAAHSFFIIVVLTLIVTVLLIVLLKKKKML